LQVFLFDNRHLAATEAYSDKGKEVDALHKEIGEYVVAGSLAYQYYKVFE
jgi:hypothetical protein